MSSEKTAIVLTAAGLSSRMHAFKPLLDLGGRALIARTISSYQEMRADPVVVVTGFQAERLETFLRSLPLSAHLLTVRNPEYQTSDMFCSIRVGLAALRDFPGPVFLSPADVPLVQPETLASLLEAARALPRGGKVACAPSAFRPVYRGRGGHPLLLTPAAVRTILRRAEEGGADGRTPGSMRGIFQSGAVHRFDVPVSDPGILMDADTPEDYQTLLSALRNRP